MKKTYFFNLIFLISLMFQFTACDDEPLEGEFPQEEEVTVEEGQFRATVEGNEFTTNSVSAVLTTTDNVLTITAVKADTGEVIVLTLENPAQDIFNLTLGNPSQINAAAYFDGINLSPYVSAFELGGSGQLQITEYDTTTNKVSGTFSFIGVRILLDAAGNPVTDANGNFVTETRNVTLGEFNKIAFTIDDTNTSGGDPDPELTNDVFFAKVDGIDFIADSIEKSQVSVGETDMITVNALNTAGQSLRIDFPQDLGVGTFPMETISDGTKIIGLYNANNGGENLTSNPGTLTITEYNTSLGIIKATFEFTGTDPLNIDPTVVNVTEGHFELYGLDLAVEVNSTFSAIINTLDFNPDEVFVSQDIFNGINRVNITAKESSTNQELGILFPKDITVGTYALEALLVNGDEKIGIYTPDINNSITFKSNTGTLTIISYDLQTGVIEGTFEFEATDPAGNNTDIHQITNGSFLVEIQ